MNIQVTKQTGIEAMKYLLLAALVYMPIFGHLDTLPIRIWDESRIAINAFEMHKNGDWVVTHFYGGPDMWNTKPPFLIWTQVLCMKILGPNELAIRLPSAFAALFTCIALLYFCVKYLKNYWLGFAAVMILCTSHAYISRHGTRTGDYDSMLTLFTTLAVLSFYLFVEYKRPKHLYYFFIALTLGVLTKSIAGLLFAPAYLIYIISQKSLVSTLKNKHFWIGAFIFLLFVLGYYLLREHYNPGYIKEVMLNDVTGRAVTGFGGDDKKPYGFYFTELISGKLGYWLPFVVLGLVVGLLNKDNSLKKLCLYFCLVTTVLYLVLSASYTKLHWYDMPAFPLMAFVAALLVQQFFFYIIENQTWLKKGYSAYFMPLLFLFILFYPPYKSILGDTYLPKDNYPENGDINFYNITHYLKKGVTGKVNLNNKFLVHEDYDPQNVFYINILNDKGVNIKKKDKENIAPNDVIIVSQEHLKKYIEETFVFKLLDEFKTVKIYEIENMKSKI